MKRLLLSILLISAHICNAQNYQCLQPGVKHYFTNSNGYLRGIRIDSVRTMGDTTVYYPFHTPRGSYDLSGFTPIILDTNGGSWLGKRVLQLADGTFIFDSYWNDSVIIKTQANIGDSWVFYRDTSSLYYKATLIATDTMTVLSALDSVKTIMINAYNGSGIVTSDPLDSFKIILSKNNGFAQVFDLYTFPYHKPDSTYWPGLDFFLDRSMCSYNNINETLVGSAPSPGVTLFKQVNFINPNDQQLHNWNIGDTIEGYHQVGGYFINYILETVSNKIISGHRIDYTLSGDNYNCPYRPDICIDPDPCFLIVNAGVYTFYDTVYSISDTLFMPEESLHLRNYIFYFPFDTSECVISPSYVLTNIDDNHLGEDIPPVFYKLGIGKTFNSLFDDGCIVNFSDGLAYTNINGISCGTLHTVGVNNIGLPENSFNPFPNPTNDELTIPIATGPRNSQPHTITLINVMGQVVMNLQTTKQQETINTTNLPAGVYNVCITAQDGSRDNNKVVIVH